MVHVVLVLGLWPGSPVLPCPFTFNVKIRLKRLSISVLIRRRQFRDIRTTLLYMCTCTGLSEHSTAVCCPSLNGSLLARPLGDYCMSL